MKTTEIITIIVSLVTIISLVIQNFILNRTIKSQIYQGFNKNFLEVDQLLIEYPEFRKYIYGNEPVDPCNPNIDKLMAVTELISDVLENIYVHQQFIPKHRKEVISNYINDVNKSPAMQYFKNTYSHWYKTGDEK